MFGKIWKIWAIITSLLYNITLAIDKKIHTYNKVVNNRACKAETKLDETKLDIWNKAPWNFPAAQSSLQGFCDPYRFDRNRNGGGIMFYIREDIPSRLIEKKLQNNIEYFFVEINLRKKKWLLCCSYNLHKNSISTHIDFLRRELDVHSSNYENFILLDFNSEITDKNLKDFCNL